MVKPQNAYAAEQRINAAAEKIMALDSDLRQLSWTRIREIAVELAASDLPASERLEYARELDSIAATNLALVQRQQVLSAMEEGEGEDDPAPDEHAAQQARVASASAAVLSQIQAEPEPGGKPQEAHGSARVVSSASVGAAGGFSHPEFPEVPDLAESDSAAGLAQRVSRKLDSLMDAVGLATDDETERRATDAVPIADADAGEAPDLKTAVDAAEPSEGDAPEESASAVPAAPADPAENDDYDAKGRWRGSTAPVNIVQMLNAEMVYQSQDEDDKDRYAAAAAQASLYDDPVAVILPSADELEGRIPVSPSAKKAEEPAAQGESESVEKAEPAQEDRHESAAAASDSPAKEADGRAALKKDEKAQAAHGGHAHAKRDDVDRLQIPEVKVPGAPGAGGTKPEDPKPAEGEPSVSVGFSAHSRAERAILAERERKEAAKREKKDARKHRFSKIFGRKNQDKDDLVIPRGKAQEAPDDLFVSDRHRAAAEKKRQETPKRKGQEKRSHTPGHAKSANDSTDSDKSDDTEGHKGGPSGGVAGGGAERGKFEQARTSSDQQKSAAGDQLDRHVAPASFELFHTSRDGRISFFRDAEGRITAVNTARLV